MLGDTECRGVTVQLGCDQPEPLLKCWCLKEYQVCDGSESFHQLLHWQLKKWSVWERGSEANQQSGVPSNGEHREPST